MEKTEGITVTVKVKADNLEAMIEEIKALPTFSLEEGGKTLVEREALIEIFRRHLKTEVQR